MLRNYSKIPEKCFMGTTWPVMFMKRSFHCFIRLYRLVWAPSNFWGYYPPIRGENRKPGNKSSGLCSKSLGYAKDLQQHLWKTCVIVNKSRDLSRSISTCYKRGILLVSQYNLCLNFDSFHLISEKTLIGWKELIWCKWLSCCFIIVVLN